MSNPSNLLLFALLLPLVGVGLIWALAPRGRGAVRACALGISLLSLATTALLVTQFPGGPETYAASSAAWLGPNTGFDVQLSVGLDGLSVWLFGLTALLVVSSVLVSWDEISERPAAFYALLLLLETGMLGVFAARDIILFYIFFEFTLIPLFFLIGIWGSEERRFAAMKFFVFTLAGSVITFLGLLSLALLNYYQQADVANRVMSFSIPTLTAGLAEHPLSTELQVVIFLALFIGFAIKVPLFPLHTWLPLAHTQAPTAGSVLLAGVLLKIGTYGFLRFNLPMLPEATALCMPYLLWLSVAGIIYGALVALVQSDVKRLIAYSSVSHLGYCMLGIFALNRLGMQGGTLQMINHGLSTGGLFACVGMLYRRYHTRQIAELGGVAREMPVLAFFMLVFTFASIGVPGLNGFAGEFPVLLGMFQRSWTSAPPFWAAQYLAIAVLAVLGVVLGAWYMLWLIQRTFFGPVKHDEHDEPITDLNVREVLALAPLVVFIVWIGVQPGLFFKSISGKLNQVTQVVEEAYDEQYPQAGAAQEMLARQPAASAAWVQADAADANRTDDQTHALNR